MALATPILRVITVLASSVGLLADPPAARADDNGTAQAESAAYFRKKFQEAQVRYRGIRVGKVRDIQLDPEDVRNILIEIDPEKRSCSIGGKPAEAST